jgi:hypothetical protein
MGPGGGDVRRGLVQGEGLGRAAFLAFGVSARAATLRVTRSLASACRMARLSARCPMVTVVVEYPAAIAASACRTLAAVSSRSFRAPMTVRIGSMTFWFFLTVLAERPSPFPVTGPAGRARCLAA